MSQSMSERFHGKVALVTGAGSGIGRATAERLYREGARVLMVDINEAGLRDAVQGWDAERAAWRVADISDAAVCAALVADAVKTFGRLDVLCNIAGILTAGHVESITPEAWQRNWQVNVSGVFFLCQAAIPELAKTKGNIVNMASTAALVGQAYAVPYGASKAAVAMISRSLALELAERGIRVNAICPGAVNTPLAANAAFPADANPRLMQKLFPWFDAAEPAEIAGLIAYVASDEARFMSGSLVAMDGAQTAG